MCQATCWRGRIEHGANDHCVVFCTVDCETGQMPGADRANLAYSCDWLAGDVVLFTTAGVVFPSAEIAALAGQFGVRRIEAY